MLSCAGGFLPDDRRQPRAARGLLLYVDEALHRHVDLRHVRIDDRRQDERNARADNAVLVEQQVGVSAVVDQIDIAAGEGEIRIDAEIRDQVGQLDPILQALEADDRVATERRQLASAADLIAKDINRIGFAIQDVSACIAFQDVEAGTAFQGIVAIVAEELVRPPAPFKTLPRSLPKSVLLSALPVPLRPPSSRPRFSRLAPSV